jgi:polysaccharide export outer membrane protein
MKRRRYYILGGIIVTLWVYSFSASAQVPPIIKPGDTLNIYVEGEDYLNAKVVVSEKGTIQYRRLGEISVEGLTVEVVGEKISNLINYHYPFLENCRVKVSRGQSEPAAAGGLSDAVYQKPAQAASGETSLTFEDTEPLYRISPYDTLEISVFGEPDLDRKLKVSDKGTIKYPLIGDVYVEGLTVEELTRKLESLLREGYFVDPHVNVFIVGYAKFSISGEVERAGTFELEGPVTLADAVVLAGGAKENADLDNVKVFRTYGEDQAKEYTVSLEEEGKVFYLKPHDRIILGTKQKIYILGAVNKPDMYYLPDETISLRDALTFLAGGTSLNANLSSVEVIRKINSDNQSYIIDVNSQGDSFLLKPQDRIIVKEYESISVFGQVKDPGRYPYTEGLTAVDAIALAGGFTSVAARNAVRVIRKEGEHQRTFNVPVGRILATGDTSQDVGLKEGDTIVVPESWF